MPITVNIGGFSMEIKKTLEGETLTLTLAGSLDSMTTPQLDGAIALDGVTHLVIDLADVSYVSSAGLRVFLQAYKTLAPKGGSVTIRSPQEAVRKVMTLTGFQKILTVV